MERFAHPVHRRSRNGLSVYRILSPAEFIEVQRVGSRYLVHHVVATVYPERLRIAELLDEGTGSTMPATAEEFEEALARTGDPRMPKG